MDGLTKREVQRFQTLVRAGGITPEQFPGKSNEAFRLLIRSIRTAS